MSEYEQFIISQQAVIRTQDGTVLVLQSANGKWILPGGRINKGEVWYDAFKRELKEETDITDFSVTGIIDVDSWFEGTQANYIVTLVCSVPKNTKVMLSAEHVAYAWVSLDELGSYTFWHPRMPERIRKAIEQFYAEERP